jgi:hypothetical protein
MYHAARFGGLASDSRRATSLLTLIQTRVQPLLRGR